MKEPWLDWPTLTEEEKKVYQVISKLDGPRYRVGDKVKIWGIYRVRITEVKFDEVDKTWCYNYDWRGTQITKSWVHEYNILDEESR